MFVVILGLAQTFGPPETSDRAGLRGGDPMEGGRRSKGEDNRRGEEVPTRLVDPKGSADSPNIPLSSGVLTGIW